MMIKKGPAHLVSCPGLALPNLYAQRTVLMTVLGVQTAEMTWRVSLAFEISTTCPPVIQDWLVDVSCV